jgi:very-short-patch-repair endonuclease
MTKRLTTEEFIEKAKSAHPNDRYDYSQVDYQGNKVRVNVVCCRHGDFQQIPSDHMRGHGCHKCDIENRPKKSNSLYLERLEKVSSGKISALEPYAGVHEKILHACADCGHHWRATAHNILSGTGCPACIKASKGEEAIYKWLETNKIHCVRQKQFRECLHLRRLRFDFFLDQRNTCIEYDGEQHFQSVSCWGGDDAYLNAKKRDEIKNEFCKNSGIKLVRISYLDKDEIDKILKSELLGSDSF